MKAHIFPNQKHLQQYTEEMFQNTLLQHTDQL